jgi:hypothetical protein
VYKIYVLCILLALMLIGLHSYQQEDGEMPFASSHEAEQDLILALDEKIPADTETATFALG